MEERAVLKSLRFQERIDKDRKDATGVSLGINLENKDKAIRTSESRANR